MANSINNFVDNIHLNEVNSLTHLLNTDDSDELKIIRHSPYFNNNNRVYTPLSEKCSQSRVFISQCHMNHIIQYYAY